MAAAVYSAQRERSVGLGLMGFHSFLQGQGVAFESAMAKSWNMRLFKHLRREADKAHKTAINRAALDAFVQGGMTEECAKLAVTLIAKKAIPAVSITY